MVNQVYTLSNLKILQKEVVARIAQHSSSKFARGVTGGLPAFPRRMHGMHAIASGTILRSMDRAPIYSPGGPAGKASACDGAGSGWPNARLSVMPGRAPEAVIGP